MSKAEEKFIEELNKEHEIILGFQEYEKKIADLESKLAEKKKEIEILTKQNKALVEEEDLLDKKLKELGVDCIEDLGKSQNQKAIEQLEKVKGLIANHTQELWTCENDDIDLVLYEEIDNQIKELKGDEV